MDFSRERVGALTDGVVAIAATLLVLDLKAPREIDDLTLSELSQYVPLFIGWLISMAMIAAIWYEQHFLFRRTSSWDNALIVVTFMQLASVSLIPFASGLVADYPQSLTAAIVFATVMLLNGSLIASNAFLLGSRPGLCEAGCVAGDLRLRAIVQIVCYVGITVLSIAGAALHHPLLGVIAWSLSPVLVAVFERRRSQTLERSASEPSTAPRRSAREI